MRFFLLLFLVWLSLTVSGQTDSTQLASCCEGKCTGSAYCTACKNCSGCKHCNSGGTCGVCSSGVKWKAAPSPSSSGTGTGSHTTKPKTTEAPSSNKPSYESTMPTIVGVISQTLNLRSGPGTEYDVVLVLSKGQVLTVLEPASNGWLKVSANQLEGNLFVRYDGYVSVKYVK